MQKTEALTPHPLVTWGWTVGLIQYRDVFDNHTPLFHIVTAPLLTLFGELLATVAGAGLLGSELLSSF